MKQYSRVYARVDLDAVAYNMEQMKQRIGEGAQIIAVIKMDGYGHGAVPIAKMLEKKEYIWGYAVACFEEAQALKNEGIKKPILVLGCVFPEQYEEMVEYDIRPTIYTTEMAQEISNVAVRLDKKASVHVKIDTGMGRLGFFPTEEGVQEILNISRLPGIRMEGVFTHFSKADEEDKTYTKMQHERFLFVKEKLEQSGLTIPYYHCDNSAGIIDFPELKHNLVRAGISTYGMYPSEAVDKDAVVLKPALELISHVTFVKEVAKGTPISYGGIFVAPGSIKAATIPVGYGDGYARGLSNKAEVLIHGKRARVIGRVCMDQLMVDVTEIPDVKFMDEVVLIGEQGSEHISVEELSTICGRFNYEFVCCLNKRVPRVYVKDGEVAECIE